MKSRIRLPRQRTGCNRDKLRFIPVFEIGSLRLAGENPALSLIFYIRILEVGEMYQVTVICDFCKISRAHFDKLVTIKKIKNELERQLWAIKKGKHFCSEKCEYNYFEFGQRNTKNNIKKNNEREKKLQEKFLTKTQ